MICNCGAYIIGIAYLNNKGEPRCAECSDARPRLYLWGRLPDEFPLQPFRHMTYRSKHTAKNREYLAAKEAVGRFVLSELERRAPSEELRKRAAARMLGSGKGAAIPFPVRIGLACWFPVKRKNRKIGNVGDWTNYYKAFEDGLKVAGVIHDDAPDFVQGPAPVGSAPSGLFPAPHTQPAPVFAWSIAAPVAGAVLTFKEPPQ